MELPQERTSLDTSISIELDNESKEENNNNEKSTLRKAQCRFFISELEHLPESEVKNRKSLQKLKEWLKEIEQQMVVDPLSDKKSSEVQSPRLSHIECYDSEKEHLKKQIQVREYILSELLAYNKIGFD